MWMLKHTTYVEDDATQRAGRILGGGVDQDAIVSHAPSRQAGRAGRQAAARDVASRRGGAVSSRVELQGASKCGG